MEFENICEHGRELSDKLNRFAIGRGLCAKFLNMQWQDEYMLLARANDEYNAEMRKNEPARFIEETIEMQDKAYLKVREMYKIKGKGD